MRMHMRVCQCIHVTMQRRCAGARRRAYRGSASESLIRVADRGRCSPITCAPTHAHCARTQRTCILMLGHPSTRHAQPRLSMRTMPVKSTHTHTQTSMPHNLQLTTYYPMHKCIFILLLYYGIIMYDCGHAHARMCSFSADALRIVEWSMLLAAIAPAPAP